MADAEAPAGNDDACKSRIISREHQLTRAFIGAIKLGSSTQRAGVGD
jgi:hypothetical protein